MSKNRLPYPNAPINNPRNVSHISGYLNEDDNTRLIISDIDDIPNIEKRTSGVYNLDSIRIARGTLFLDHESAISTVGVTIQLTTLASNEKQLIPGVPFTDSGTVFLKTQILDDRVDNEVIQPTFSTDIVSTEITGPVTFSLSRLIHTISLKTGTTAATQPVTLTLSRGLTPGGQVVFEKNFPTSEFPSSSDVEIDLDTGLGFEQGDEIFFTFSSDANFSLLGTVTDIPYLAIDSQLLDSLDVVTENFVVNNNLEHVFSNDLSIVYPNQF